MSLSMDKAVSEVQGKRSEVEAHNPTTEQTHKSPPLTKTIAQNNNNSNENDNSNSHSDIHIVTRVSSPTHLGGSRK